MGRRRTTWDGDVHLEAINEAGEISQGKCAGSGDSEPVRERTGLQIVDIVL